MTKNNGNSSNGENSGTDDFSSILIAGTVLVLSAYGLFKLFTREPEPRKSISSLKEMDFIDEIVDGENL